jgi:TPR repeat protein
MVQVQCNAGFYFFKGQGTLQDYKQAFQWYEKAARQGNANAELALAVLYSRGEGVPQDSKQALAYFLKAAQHGEPPWVLADAQYKLGECFERGWGTAVDLKAARSWYAKAAARGDEMGRGAALDRLTA